MASDVEYSAKHSCRSSVRQSGCASGRRGVVCMGETVFDFWQLNCAQLNSRTWRRVEPGWSGLAAAGMVGRPHRGTTMTEPYTEAALRAARAATAAYADQPDARASDPQRLGWMTGAPPAADKRMAFADNSRNRFPQIRWAFSHQRRFLPTCEVWRGEGPVSLLPRASRDLGDVRLTP